MGIENQSVARLKARLINKFKQSAPTLIIVVISLIVAGFNFSLPDENRLSSDRSIAAGLVATSPKLNLVLADKINKQKLNNNSGNLQDSVNNGNIFVRSASAANLTDDDQSDKKPFEYEVQAGDTLSKIAEEYQLKLNTILWANNLTAKSVIRPGQKITLLPVDGVLYTLKRGDTVGKIAILYKADSRKIMDYNDITDATRIHAGDVIIIPDGQPLAQTVLKPDSTAQPQKNKSAAENDENNNPPTAAPPVASDSLVWPTTVRNISQKYSAKHRGIDISNGGKPPIFASQSGVVEFAGKSGDWGNTILIRGDDGLVTRYSHSSEIDVGVGDYVSAGNKIGVVGNTGRVRGATGLHLDFRVYKNGVAVNPLNFLN